MHISLISWYFLDSCVPDPTRIYQIVVPLNNLVVHHAGYNGAPLYYDAVSSVTNELCWRFIPINGTSNVYWIHSTSSNVVVDGTAWGAADQIVSVWGIATNGANGGQHQWCQIDSYFGYCKITNFYNNQSWGLYLTNQIKLQWFVGNGNQVFKILGKKLFYSDFDLSCW